MVPGLHLSAALRQLFTSLVLRGRSILSVTWEIDPGSIRNEFNNTFSPYPSGAIRPSVGPQHIVARLIVSLPTIKHFEA